jgi:hypothetical protein
MVIVDVLIGLLLSSDESREVIVRRRCTSKDAAVWFSGYWPGDNDSVLLVHEG